ncbi:SLC13 family permease [Lentzea sp. BCCO 10_0061]|uniref:SLC13 family permease n=1 Tax=Lentzea sokolovensis TaxID=3095429 RepID=A0ABU4UNT5_9PSEU|nr:SLC13 family permease [Lentzea sp. BCCO 10_0061]MDX8140689.1 SLC13 family permease [Lentzea sp. BCCO 10_0061]
MLTLVVFAVAVVLWTCTPLDDTFVALAAVVVLLLFGVLPASALAVLGGSTTWLLIAAFVLASGVSASGLPARLATSLAGRARSVRGLLHLTAFALLLTAFLVPSTSGRAALALPVHGALRERVNSRVSRALGVLFPSVILLTAVATLVGAGAHLITSALLEQATGEGIGFGQWLVLGLPLALVSAHLTAEVVLWLFTTRADRAERLGAEPLGVDESALVTAARSEGPLPGVPCSNSPRQHRQFRALSGSLTIPLPAEGRRAEGRCTEAGPTSAHATSAHATAGHATSGHAAAGHPSAAHPTAAHPTAARPASTRPTATLTRVVAPLAPPAAPKTIRAVIAGLTRPELTAVAILAVVSAAWLTEPWHHVPPEVTALAGAIAITTPRLGLTTLKQAMAEIPWSLLLFMAATTMLGTALVGSGAAASIATLISPSHLLPTVIAVSLLAHLVVQSRSARSSVLIPIVIPLAVAAGLNPAALAFASTAAAGFCHTFTSSAKPVALFADAYRPKDLLKLSAVLAPITGAFVLACAVLLWPHLGLPLK